MYIKATAETFPLYNIIVKVELGFSNLRCVCFDEVYGHFCSDGEIRWEFVLEFDQVLHKDRSGTYSKDNCA